MLNVTALPTSHFQDTGLSVFLRIVADIIVIAWADALSDPLQDNVAVYHWPTNQILRQFISNAATRYLDAVLACEKYLLLLCLDQLESPACNALRLEIYELTIDTDPSIDQVMHISNFELPVLSPQLAEWGSLLSADRQRCSLFLDNRMPSPLSPSACAPEDLMVYFDLHGTIGDEDSEFNFVTYSFFASLSTFIRDTTASSPDPTTYPWSAWGPEGTHLCVDTHVCAQEAYDDPNVNKNHRYHKPVFLSGYRVIVNHGTALMDFNPYYVSKLDSSEHLPPGAKVVKDPCLAKCLSNLSCPRCLTFGSHCLLLNCTFPRGRSGSER
ncbi:hypothetical protein K474DRAFT_452923 [Panus rudis PR-1116 ss-1]|nr:hypothetical protein K474DRAFT_452923 [Panus rudis PR-1116 ss-1]